MITYRLLACGLAAAAIAALTLTACVDELESAPAVCPIHDGGRLAAALEKMKAQATPEGLVRAIVTVRNDPSCMDLERAKATLAERFQAAGALLVEPLHGLPAIVVECSLDQLREVAKSGLIEDVRPDIVTR